MEIGKEVIMTKLQFLLLNFVALLGSIQADDIYAPVTVYDQIEDLCNPTLEDYRKIQYYLTHGERSIIKKLKDYQPNARNFKLIGDKPDELPQSGMVAVNCSEEERENCILCYSSFNKNYPRGLKRLIDVVSQSDFRGHLLHRLGGWPDLEGGSLVLAHVPYAFKVSFFREARRLGYKRAFWMDTALVPVVSLNKIFEIIANDGYFVFGNSHVIGPYMDPTAADAFGMTMKAVENIPSCSAGIFGVDFTTEIGNKLVDTWYQAASNRVAFFSPRSDQNALSIILHNFGIKNLVPIERLAHHKDAIKSDSLLLIDRSFVNELSLEK